jgi:hypothetical protein
VTFVGICWTPGADVARMREDCEQARMKDLPFPKMLDANGITRACYRIAESRYVLAVVDGRGNLRYAGEPGLYRAARDERERVYLRHVEADKAVKQAPGLLAGVSVPGIFRSALHFYNLQQFGPLSKELDIILKADPTPPTQQFGKLLRSKVDGFRAARAQELTALAGKDPVAGYREILAFAQAFPQTPESAALDRIAAKLRNSPKVAFELEAEKAYRDVLAPALKRPKTMQEYTRWVKPVYDAYLARYGGAEFAGSVRAAAEALRERLDRGGW